jgi:ABC-2 type transport system permease protein
MGVALLLLLLCVGFGALAYGVEVPTAAGWAKLLLTLLVGGASFAALGLACTTIVPNADAAPAIVNGTILPVLFLSDVFINTAQAPGWVQWVGKVFPVTHFVEALQSALAPAAVPWSWWNILIVLAWGVAGLVVAVRGFRWEPRR